MTETFQSWLDNLLANPGRESHTGYHYIYAYVQDPYGWYLKYVRHLKPIHTKPALIMGGALHSAIEAAYRFDSEDSCLKTFKSVMQSRKAEYIDTPTYLEDVSDGTAMLKCWLAAWLRYDFTTYHLLHIEDEFSLPLSNGMLITVRPDLIVARKTDGNLRILDHKSTRWSIPKAHASLEGTDQSTSYIWAVQQLYPSNVLDGVESDILYKNKSVVKAERVALVQRTAHYIAEWELATCGILDEIARKVRLLEEGYPAAYLFPRNSFAESYFGSEWPDIYRATLPDDPSTPPYGYTIDAWQGGNT